MRRMDVIVRKAQGFNLSRVQGGVWRREWEDAGDVIYYLGRVRSRLRKRMITLCHLYV